MSGWDSRNGGFGAIGDGRPNRNNGQSSSSGSENVAGRDSSERPVTPPPHATREAPVTPPPKAIYEMPVTPPPRPTRCRKDVTSTQETSGTRRGPRTTPLHLRSPSAYSAENKATNRRTRSAQKEEAHYQVDNRKTLGLELAEAVAEKMAGMQTTTTNRSMFLMHVDFTHANFVNIVETMKRHKKELFYYDQTKNMPILHLDWAVGNPDDPIEKVEVAAETAKMSAMTMDVDAADGMGQENMDKIADMVSRITYGDDKMDPKKDWNKTLLYGDWLYSYESTPIGGMAETNQPDHFIEIQFKRVSGSDPELLTECGVKPEYVFVALEKNPDELIEKAIAAKDAVDAKQAATAPLQRGFIPKSPAFGTFPISASTGDFSKSSEPKAPGGGQLDGGRDQDEEKVNMDEVGASQTDDDDYDTVSTESIEAVSNAQTVKATRDRTRLAANVSNVLTPEAEAAIRAVLPSGTTRMNRVRDSFVYVVRVLAFPATPVINNKFLGPRLADRRGTLLGTGGWVAPPMAEREAEREAEHQHARRNRIDHDKYEAIPKPMAHRAMPSRLDSTSHGPIDLQGSAAPLWNDVSEPTLEDVYWLVWELLAGREFFGFRRGFRFGWDSFPISNTVAMTAVRGNPFQSPSEESLRHAANRQ